MPSQPSTARTALTALAVVAGVCLLFGGRVYGATPCMPCIADELPAKAPGRMGLHGPAAVSAHSFQEKQHEK